MRGAKWRRNCVANFFASCVSVNPCSGKFEQVDFDAEWSYGECSLYKNIIAVGQPKGEIALFDIETHKMVRDFTAFPNLPYFFWSDIKINSKIVVCSGTVDKICNFLVLIQYQKYTLFVL